ncbi:hypothetical protein BaRGS_00009043 [Batillaria attramentaria]|uniref:G-protein coupled receptors family 1 profile domain-containing protein n=1 Tax=Batillaria attramentaria TaxID=370345 RepID=A0ABD0LK85_9CAEN
MSNPGKPTPTVTATTASSAMNVAASTAPTWRRENTFWNSIYVSIKVAGCLEAILILATNVFLFAVLLSSPKLRGNMRNHLVLSLVVANLIVGVFSSPFAVDYTVRRDWVHGCYFHVVRSLLTVFVQNFVSMWGVVLLALHYLCRLLQYDGPAFLLRLPTMLRRMAPGVYVALPWLVALLLVVPLVFGGLHHYVWVLWTDTKCPMMLSRWAKYTLNVLTYFLPAVLLIVLFVTILFVYRRRVTHFGANALKKMEMGANLVGEGEEVEGPAVHVVLALLTVIFMGPEHLFYVGRFHTLLPMKHAVILGVSVMLLSESLPLVMALVLLFMLADVRTRVVELYCMIPGLPFKRSPPPSSQTTVAPVAFRDLNDD